MKTLYLDCGMGAAGDMLTAALLELLPEPDVFIQEMNELGIPGVCVKKEPSVKCGITGTHISVTINGEEEESHDFPHHHEHQHQDEHGHHDVPDHEHEHKHQHQHNHEHEHENHHEHNHIHEYEHEHDHRHNHIHEHEHEHDHRHNHVHEHNQRQQHDHTHHHHSSLHDIEHIVRNHLAIPDKVKDDIMTVYELIAQAESHAHGVPVSQIHFHEVGTMDAIADITAVCLLMNKLSPDEVVVSPIHVGSGKVRCAHGILPVPAPATAHILKNVPVYGGNIQGELCTPTGAALLKHFATRFGNMPVIRTEAIGYGMGKKDFEAANCVRALLGETEDKTDVVLELSCNVDDMTAEEISFAMDRLFDGGALEVYTIPIGMKKSRPGSLIRVMCLEKDRETMIALIFKHTTTIGIRETETHRYVLDRTVTTLETPYGTVRRKDSSGYGVSRSKLEYEDIARIAKEQTMSIADVRKQIASSTTNSQGI